MLSGSTVHILYTDCTHIGIHFPTFCIIHFRMSCFPCLKWVNICEYNIISDLVAIVPGVQCPFFGVIVNLSNVSGVIAKRESGGHLCVGMCIKGIAQVVLLLISMVVSSIQNTTHDKTVAIALTPQPCPPRGFSLHGQFVRV